MSSSTPKRKGSMHGGVGRIGVLGMHPMSLFESGDSTEEVSLKSLFNTHLPTIPTGEVKLQSLAELTARGGWPDSLGASQESARELAKSYLDLTVEDDATRIDGVKRDPRRLRLLLRSLARNESTLAKNSTFQRDILEFDDTLAPDTVTDYLAVLRKLFVLWEQGAYDPNLRSSARVGKKSKRHLADPSLAAAALEIGASDLMGDLNTFGFLFEALCERDLAIYAQSFGGTLKHYRDAQNHEIDAVVELRKGVWGAFEIKLGANQIDEAATHLITMKQLMERDKTTQPPAILAVICGMSSAAYTRPDGVMVVPPAALRP